MISDGIFRFAGHLPAVADRVSLGEGNTPVVRLSRLGERLGLRLTAKLEGLNPTGSYKDRIAAMSMSLAKSAGRRGWIATSSGNAGMALAAYGAAADLHGIIFAGRGAPAEKTLSMLAFGSEVFLVDSVGEEKGSRRSEQSLFDTVSATARQYDLYLAVTAHAFNPDGMRGADTIGHEIQRDGHKPRVVYVPTGGGGLACAVARGLRETGNEAAVAIAQPAGCSPVVRYIKGELPEPVIEVCESKISALQLTSPPDGRAVAQVVKSGGGWGTAVDDAEIWRAQHELASLEGVFVEPAAAASLAAVSADRRAGLLERDDEVMLILTATGLKDLGAIRRSVSTPRVISTQEVESVVRAVLGE